LLTIVKNRLPTGGSHDNSQYEQIR